MGSTWNKGQRIKKHNLVLSATLFWPSSYSKPTFLCNGLTGNVVASFCDPWKWQISPPASKLCVLTSADVSIGTTAFSPPLLLRDPHLKQVPILLKTWVEKKGLFFLVAEEYSVYRLGSREYQMLVHTEFFCCKYAFWELCTLFTKYSTSLTACTGCLQAPKGRVPGTKPLGYDR